MENSITHRTENRYGFETTSPTRVCFARRNLDANANFHSRGARSSVQPLDFPTLAERGSVRRRSGFVQAAPIGCVHPSPVLNIHIDMSERGSMPYAFLKIEDEKCSCSLAEYCRVSHVRS